MLVASKTRREKKRRGVFYSPPRISRLLARWTIREPTERVLEPSFGGCGFLEATAERLQELGGGEFASQVFGCDVDRRAFVCLHRLNNGTTGAGHFLHQDFLELQPSDFGRKRFHAILGNPPYVSQHNMFLKQRRSAALAGSDDRFGLSGLASLWAYFVFHALRFLDTGGRMAWLLPGSALHADYAKKLLRELGRRFRRVAVISLRERLFSKDGTDETTEVLLCEGFASTEPQIAAVEIFDAPDIATLECILATWSTGPRGAALNGRACPALFKGDGLREFHALAESAVCLSDLAIVRIGIVTGANRFFILSGNTAREHALPETTLRPILAKSAAAPGLELRPGDLDTARAAGIPCLLFNSKGSPQHPAVKVYLARISAKVRKSNITFGKRAEWDQPDDNRIPSAFLPYMHHMGPRLILNAAAVNSTNTIHRVYFHPEVSPLRRRLTALSILSTFSQLSAEIEGRAYGAGVLKHEIGEAGSIRMLLPPIRKSERELIKRIIIEADAALRKGSAAEASAFADLALAALLEVEGATYPQAALRNALEFFRSRRLRLHSA